MTTVILQYLSCFLTNFMRQSPSSENDSCLTSKEMYYFYKTWKVHSHVHKSPQLNTIYLFVVYLMALFID
jgi:hypothetical protein